MRVALLLFLSAGLAFVSSSDGGEKGEKKDKLDGTWKVESSVNNGKEEADAKEHTLIIAGKTFAVKKGDDTLFKGTIQTNATKKPHEIDFTFTDGPDDLKGKTAKGIYEVKGDSLQFCVAADPSDGRPSEFTSPEGGKRHLVSLKRVEK
jgi:uncharacterized protein (TIGR03067 family)